MTDRPTVFVGSSSAARPVLDAIQRLLDTAAVVHLWPSGVSRRGAFTLQALTEEVEKADFAILVVSPDDATKSGGKEQLSPRDDVVFELGLFVGGLGRERCFVLEDERMEQKLPTDLLGVTVERYRLPDPATPEALERALGPACARLRAHIRQQCPRIHLMPAELAITARTREFCGRAVGCWWEKVTPEHASVMSFMRIKYLPDTATLRLKGRAFDTSGERIAQWESVSATADPVRERILYRWEGYLLANPATTFRGFGDIDFVESPGSFEKAFGAFFDADLSHPDSLCKKSFEMRRCDDPEQVRIMNGASTSAIRGLVSETATAW